MMPAPELVLDARADLGESPAWDARRGRLYWVDIRLGHLHIFDPNVSPKGEDGTDRVMDVGEPLGCVAPTRSGGLVLARCSGFALLDPPLPKCVLSFGERPGEGSGVGSKLRALATPEPHLPGNRFNDGKCDPAGRFLAGSMDNAEVEATGSLYSLAPDGSLKTLLTDRRISNGLAWSPDYRTFYYIDTPTRTVMAYDYDLATGGIGNPRPAVSVPLNWAGRMA